MNEEKFYGAETVKVRGGEVGHIVGFETIDNVRHVDVRLRIGPKITVPLNHVSKVRQLPVRSI